MQQLFMYMICCISKMCNGNNKLLLGTTKQINLYPSYTYENILGYISNVKYPMWNIQCEISNVEYPMWNIQGEIFNVKYWK
jgi:hypothetical protein